MDRPRVIIVGIVSFAAFVLSLLSPTGFVAFVNWASLVVAASVGCIAYIRRFNPNVAEPQVALVAALVVSLFWSALYRPSNPLVVTRDADTDLDETDSGATPATPPHLRTDWRLTLDPLPKDQLLTLAAKEGRRDAEALRICHEALIEQSKKFDDWELLDVKHFTTRGPRGTATVVPLVTKTKLDGKWTVWDQAWFVRDGELIADFDTSEFKGMSAFGWCLQQEEIVRVYGPK